MEGGGLQAYHVVDAFTSTPFAGNPAAVVLANAFPADVRMHAIAREFNLAETAFLAPVDGVRYAYHLRWFTPAVEVDLCGHATLASAHFLFRNGHVPEDQAAVFLTRSGTLTCTRDGDMIVMDFPAEPPELCEPPEHLIHGLKLAEAPLYVGKNRMDILVQLSSAAAVRALQPDLGTLAKIPTRCVIVTAPGDQEGIDMVSRVFGPAVGVNEDPVTGSAHCCLAVYWAARLQRNRLTGFQASARGGTVHMVLDGQRVHLKGHAVTIAQGNLIV